MIGKYFWNILLWLDQGLSCLFGGDPRETISSRMAKKRNESQLARDFCTILDKIDNNHCNENIDVNVGDKEL